MKSYPQESIAAIATPSGRGGVGIVRVSGVSLTPLMQAILDKPVAPRHAQLRCFLDAGGGIIDTGLALYFPAPGSYTGEEVLELHGHGGAVVMQLLLRRCVELGARIARPGEFTERAYLNGKLDLAQAESVADLIDASTESAARSAQRSLAGEFSRAVRALVDDLIHLRVLTEAALDFPEEEIDPAYHADMSRRLDGVREKLAGVFTKARQGNLLRAGLTVVLAGQPNVGKSSLLNALAGEDLAIVTPIAGTTRDAVKTHIQIKGVPLNIIDTAGLRDTADEVERIGIARTWDQIKNADVIVLLADARTGITDADGAIVDRLPAGAPRLDVFNKTDLTDSGARRVAQNIYLSAKRGEGVSLLRDALLEVAGWQPGGEDTYLARERHLTALRNARTHLEAAGAITAQLELFAEELSHAQRQLSEITGEFTPDDLLGEIFSRFCIGK